MRWRRFRAHDRGTQRIARTTGALAAVLLIGTVTTLCRPAAAGTGTIARGELTLHACAPPGAYCGSLERALDPLGEIPGTIRIGFEYYPHRTGQPLAGVLVATEGGPGFAARESRTDYLALFRPLMRDHDVLIMDNRGTGSSAAVDCPSLQRAEAIFTVEAVAACGALLGPTAWLYSTSYAADDLAALLDALGIATIGLYGDSYGTFTAQTFATRHPDRLGALVLDGAYPLRTKDGGWYPSYAPAMRDKFNIACERSEACHAVPGTSIDHVRPALERLRRSPVKVRAYDADGRSVELTADSAALATAMFGGAPALATVRELDAAARAYTAGDPLPLNRLLAEARVNVESRDASYDPRLFSSGVAAAIMCGDAPQIFDMTLPPDARRIARDHAVEERARQYPDAFAPFTYGEYRAIPLDYAFIDECVLWPAVSDARRASIVATSASHFPDAPVLVLSGELDNMTTVQDGKDAAGSFPNSTQVILRNSFHVNALPRARTACGAKLVRRFLQDGVLDDTCSARIPPVRLVTRFAKRADDLDPATPLAGTASTTRELKVAAAAVAAIGDIVVRARDNTSGHGHGLRGGTFSVSDRSGTRVVKLQAVQWTDDVLVDGTATINELTHHVEAHVIATAQADSADLHVAWNDSGDAQAAMVTGRISGHRIHASIMAP